MLSTATIWGLWSAVSRFWNKETALAIGIGVGSIAIVAGLLIAGHNYKATLTAARDGEWQSKLSQANDEHKRARERMSKAADEAAAFEREAAKRALDDEIEARAALERTLAQIGATDDPVAIPKQLAKELRR